MTVHHVLDVAPLLLLLPGLVAVALGVAIAADALLR